MDEIEFSIEEDALMYIVEKAVEYKLGARDCVLFVKLF